MKRKLLNILVCPACHGSLDCYSADGIDDSDIKTGHLTCMSCQQLYPIVNGIPRFVSNDQNYANSFGYQWNKYKLTQIDRFAKNNASRDRLLSETAWDFSRLEGKWMLDAGCGNGRFLDIATESDAEVVGIDMSNAVDAAQELLQHRNNLHLVQADLQCPPFKPETFDYVYSIGVIQHTPAPLKIIQNIANLVKPNGQIAVTIYEKKKWTYFNGKYLIRPVTKRMNNKCMLAILKVASPLLFPITEILFRLPLAGRFFQFMIPYANYVEWKAPMHYRYSLALLDTFDMLTPTYDYPQTQKAVEKCLLNAGITDVKRLHNDGLNLIGKKSNFS